MARRTNRYAIAAPKTISDPQLAGVVRELNEQLAHISERFNRLGLDDGAFTKDIDASNFTLGNVATYKGSRDVVTREALENALEELDDEAAQQASSEEEMLAQGRTGGRTRRERRSSRRRLEIEEAAFGAILDLLPTAAPPNVAAASAIGTTSLSPPRFSMEDHTHGGVLGAPVAGGVAEQVAFFTSTFQVDGDANFTWQAAERNLLVGTEPFAWPDSASHIGYSVGAEGTDQAVLQLWTAGTGNAPLFLSVASRGTLGTPTATQLNDGLGDWEARGYDGANYVDVTSMFCVAEENFTGAANGAGIRFSTTPIGSTTITETLRLTGNGVVRALRGHVQIENTGTASELRLFEPSGGGTSYTGFISPALAGNIIYTMPATSAAGYLRNDGANVLSWDASGAGIDHGGLTGLGDDDHAQYLLLAGRAGTANNALISTSGGTGTITGSTSGGGILRLDGSTSTLNSTERVAIACGLAIGQTTSDVPAPLGTYSIIDIWNFSHTTASGDNPTLRAVNFSPSITWGDDPNAIQLYRYSTTHLTANNVARTLTNGSITVQSTPTWTPVGASGSWTISAGIFGMNHSPTFTNAGAGNTAVSVFGLSTTGAVNSNWTVTDMGGLIVNDPSGSGTITNLYGVKVAALTSHTSTIVAAFSSAVAAASGKFFLHDTGGAQSRFQGIITTYDNIATVERGIPYEVASINLTAQGAAIAATTIYAVPASGAGFYRISWTATVTRAATTSSTLGGATTGFRITYTNANDAVAKTTPLAAAPAAGTNQAYSQTNQLNTTGATISGVIVVRAAASTNIQYSIGYTSAGATTMQYDLSVVVERL